MNFTFSHINNLLVTKSKWKQSPLSFLNIIQIQLNFTVKRVTIIFVKFYFWNNSNIRNWIENGSIYVINFSKRKKQMLSPNSIKFCVFRLKYILVVLHYMKCRMLTMKRWTNRTNLSRLCLLVLRFQLNSRWSHTTISRKSPESTKNASTLALFFSYVAVLGLLEVESEVPLYLYN